MSDDPFALLHAARVAFGPGARATKAALLERCGRQPPTGSRRIRQFHDTLLFVAAYPDDRSIGRLAEEHLHRLADVVRNGNTSPFEGSGIAGTAIEAPFSVESARWLLRRFPGEVDIAWDEEDAAGPGLDDILGLCVDRAERDGLLETSLSTREWFAAATGGPGRDLPWLLDRIEAWSASPEVVDHLFDSLDLAIRWRLTDPASSITFARFPPRTAAAVGGALRRRVALRRVVARPLPSVTVLPRRAATSVLEAARVSLLARSRETDPVTYAHPGDVTLVALERGIDVALFSMRPARRMPIESYIGYVIARNRIPVGYGGAWIFFDRAEIGVNVFDAFRGGESALLFAQIVRVYHQHLGVRRFLVDPYQFGAGNREGIRSGAYWFYHRLGFRSVDPKLRALAESEWARIRADRTHRTPASVLRRFARARVALDLRRPGGRATDVPDLAALSLTVSRHAGARFNGDRAAAARWARRRLRSVLGPLGERSWPAAERAGFDSLAPLVALIPSLDQWPAAATRALIPLMRAKGGARERPFVLALQRHPRLASAWNELLCSTNG